MPKKSKYTITLPFRVPRIGEARSVACKAYWDMAAKRVQSPGHQRALREFFESIRKTDGK